MFLGQFKVEIFFSFSGPVTHHHIILSVVATSWSGLSFTFLEKNPGKFGNNSKTFTCGRVSSTTHREREAKGESVCVIKVGKISK